MSFKTFFEKKHAVCDVCGVDTKSFDQFGSEDIKQLVTEFPLNKHHVDTYRKGFEFMVKPILWKVFVEDGIISNINFKNKSVRVDENLYICLECFEREILTSILRNIEYRKLIAKNNKDASPENKKLIRILLQRLPNKFGFVQISPSYDLFPNNTVNNNFLEFESISNKVIKKLDTSDEFSHMISKSDRKEFSDYDDDGESLDFSDYN